jgi:ABC-2 type transport system ATP-binding protein
VHFDGPVAGFVGLAQGRAWLADDRDPAALHAWRTGSGRIRNVGTPPPGAETVEATLEDAYLLLLGDRARADRLEVVA